jgi:hypothetical protein
MTTTGIKNNNKIQPMGKNGRHWHPAQQIGRLNTFPASQFCVVPGQCSMDLTFSLVAAINFLFEPLATVLSTSLARAECLLALGWEFLTTPSNK